MSRRNQIAAGRDRTDSLLREYIELSVGTPTSRLRRMDASGLRRPAPEPFAGLLLPEEYVRRVLGVDRAGLLAEGADPTLVSDMVVREHLLFEGWWDKAKEAVAGFLKKNPISDTLEAAKKLGTNIQGVTFVLTQAVSAGGGIIDSITNSAGNLLGKRIGDVRKSVAKVVKRLKELINKVTKPDLKAWLSGVADSVTTLVDRIVAKIREATSGGGWKGMLARLTAYMAVQAIAAKAGPLSDLVTDALSGDPKKMAAAAGQIAAAGIEDEDDDNDDPPPAEGEEGLLADGINKLTDAFRGFAMGLVKKALGTAGEAAVEQLAGPAGWLKAAADVFQKVAGGISWVCERIMEVAGRVAWPTSTPAGSGGGT